jgi:hypothetical protein
MDNLLFLVKSNTQEVDSNSNSLEEPKVIPA